MVYINSVRQYIINYSSSYVTRIYYEIHLNKSINNFRNCGSGTLGMGSNF